MAEVTDLSAAEMATMLGTTPRKLRDLAERGLVVKAGRGRYEVLASVRSYVAHLREVASGRGGEAEVTDLSRERARLAKLQADEREMRNAALRGELLPAVEVERTWTDVMRRVRSGVLAVPSRVRQSCPHLTPHDVGEIDGELRRALEGLGRNE